MALMFGLSRPVPSTTRTKPRKNACIVGIASTKCPLAIMMPPNQTAFCAPISRSAIQPPGRATRYTAAV